MPNLNLQTQRTLDLAEKIHKINLEMKTELDEISNTITRLENSGEFYSVAANSAIQNYKGIKIKFDEFYDIVDLHYQKLNEAVTRTIETDNSLIGG